MRYNPQPLISSLQPLMSLDVLELREFYVNPLGRVAQRLLRERVGRFWPDLRGESVAALGYGTPLLRPWLAQADALFAFMSAGQGAVYWPREGPNATCLADLTELPLEDESVSRVILFHALEVAADAPNLLREVWRVLKSNGRVLVVAPNRRGLWAHNDRNPFGTGRPYSSFQLRDALRDQGFLVERVEGALYAPPCRARLALAVADGVEKYGAKLFSGFGGLLVMEAAKQVYAPLLTKSRVARGRLTLPLPFPVPQGPIATGRDCLAFLKNCGRLGFPHMEKWDGEGFA